jgi:hypothetical protein
MAPSGTRQAVIRPTCQRPQRFPSRGPLYQNNPHSTVTGGTHGRGDKASTHWRRLWKEKLEHRSRTILWRLYHDKLSNEQRMHKINPERPATCHTCGEEETTEHMVATCDAKRTVWETCLTTYSTTTIWNNTTILSLLKLHKISLKLKQTTQFTKLQLIGPTLLSIWDHHWRTKLDNSIFSRIVGQSAALRRLRTLQRQIAFFHSTSI